MSTELDIAILRDEVEALREKEQIAQRALLSISNINPTRYIKQPVSPSGLSFVKACAVAQEKAETALLAMADVDVEPEDG